MNAQSTKAPYNRSNKKRFLGVPYIAIIALGSLTLSLAMILTLHYMEPSKTAEIVNGKIVFPSRSIWHIILEHVATGLFILGVWHTADQLLIKKEFNEEIVSHFEEANSNILQQIKESNEDSTNRFNSAQKMWSERMESIREHFTTARHDTLFGLVSTHHEANQFGYSSMIEESNQLTCVMADGYGWCTNHSESLLKRFESTEKRTTFILVHPQSEMIVVIARKVGMQPNLYRERIYQTIRLLRKLTGNNDKIVILGHSLITCHAAYLADRTAVFAPYFMSTQRRVPPVITVKDAGTGSFYQKLHNDINFLKTECIPINLPEDGP